MTAARSTETAQATRRVDVATMYDGRHPVEIKKASCDLRRDGLVVLFRGADGRAHFLGADSGVSDYEAMRDGGILLFDQKGYVEHGCPAYQHRSRWASKIRATGDGFKTSVEHSALTLRAHYRAFPAIVFFLQDTGRRDPIFDDSEAMFMVSKLRASGYTADQIAAAMLAWDEHERIGGCG